MAVARALGAMQKGVLLDKEAMGKPGVFSGKESDWPAWHFVFQSRTMMLSQKVHAEIQEAAEMPQPVTVVTGARETQAHILVLMVGGRALEMQMIEMGTKLLL